MFFIYYFKIFIEKTEIQFQTCVSLEIHRKLQYQVMRSIHKYFSFTSLCDNECYCIGIRYSAEDLSNIFDFVYTGNKYYKDVKSNLKLLNKISVCCNDINMKTSELTFVYLHSNEDKFIPNIPFTYFPISLFNVSDPSILAIKTSNIFISKKIYGNTPYLLIVCQEFELDFVAILYLEKNLSTSEEEYSKTRLKNNIYSKSNRIKISELIEESSYIENLRKDLTDEDHEDCDRAAYWILNLSLQATIGFCDMSKKINEEKSFKNGQLIQDVNLNFNLRRLN